MCVSRFPDKPIFCSNWCTGYWYPLWRLEEVHTSVEVNKEGCSSKTDKVGPHSKMSMPLALPCLDIERCSFTAQRLEVQKFPKLLSQKLMPDLLVVVPKLLKPKQGNSVVNHGVIQTSDIEVPRVNYLYQSVQC